MSDSAAQSLALSLGVSALVSVACRRLRVPSLLPLLVVGVGLGTSGLGVVDAGSLGNSLTGFITVAIGLLIFEGALHLNREELGRAPRAVWGLLTVGALLTWIGASVAAHYLLGFTWPIAIILGAALIVTGPTVVQPILRSMRVAPRLHAVLGAEAVLIDPLGVVATVTTLEIVRRYLDGGPALGIAGAGAFLFLKPLIGGACLGIVMGVVGRRLLQWLGHAARPDPRLVNLVAVGVCMTCVGLGEAIAPEGGLAAVTICGVIMARAKVLGATELRAFKELLAVMLVGTLFVLLASRFDIRRLSVVGWREAAFVGVLLFAIRPVAVTLSTFRSRLSPGERAFAATFAPRGIVALSVTAVAAAELRAALAGDGTDSASTTSLLLADVDRLDVVMFVTIVGTVLAGTIISPVIGWALRVRAGEGSAVMLIGGHPLSVAFAKLLSSHGVHVRIVDQSIAQVHAAQAQGLDAIAGDATDARWMDDIAAPDDVGWVIAWTGNHDVDQLAARWAEDRLGRGRTAIWSGRHARASLGAADVGGGEPVTDAIARIEDGEVICCEGRDRTRFARIVGWVSGSQFTLNVPASRALSAPGDATFLGLAERTLVSA
ncbi:MAG: sodium:proton antiporter [Phycisphaerae bacterium]|nr:sodium:proton antiporter [Phycisphaerae bacterium]